MTFDLGSLVRRVAVPLALGAAMLSTTGALARAQNAAAPAAGPAIPGLVCRISTSWQSHSPADTIAADQPDPNAPPPPPAGGRGGGGGGGGGGGRGGGGAGGAGGAGAGGAGGGRGGAGGPQMRRLVMSASIAPGLVHMDVSGQAGTGAELSLNDYLIATDTDQTIVDFSAHTYRKTTMTIGSIVDLANALDKHSPVIMTKLEFDTLKVATGDTIDGLPTRHYQLKMDYRGYQPDSMNELKQSSTTFVADYWVADGLVRFTDPFIGFDLPKPGYSPGLKVWIEKIQTAAEVVNMGTPVKFEANYESNIEWPRPMIYKRTMDLTGCTKKDIDATLFAVPAGYTMRAGRGGGGGGD